MARNLLDNKNRGDSNREVIELYLVSDPGTVELNDQQKQLLKRWEYADELIRIKEIRTRELQSQMIMRLFNVSRTTAYQDIVNAEAVFASSTPLNKKYRIGLRIEFLEKKIDELYGNVKPFEPTPEDLEEVKEGEEPNEDPFAKMGRMRENEEYITQAIMLEKVLQKYYDIYPTFIPPKSPRTIVFRFNNTVLPAAPMTAEEALRRAGKIIDIKPRENNGRTDTES
jgi:hypothetical protein